MTMLLSDNGEGALSSRVQIQNTMHTGQSFVESLGDGREVIVNGERVKDIANHPAFRNSVRSIARLYDALHDPSSIDTMTTVDPDGYRTHAFFAPSFSTDDLLHARDAIAHWSRLTYGFMGRTPDYKAGFSATLHANPEFYEPFSENARRWYEKITREVMFLSHVLVNPPIGRGEAVSKWRDIYLHVEKERADGIVVRGAKMVGTSAPFCHAAFVAQNSALQLVDGQEEDFALVFIVPMNTPNLQVICRKSYETAATSPFDNPLSSRFDENDSVLVFDDVFVPWENVLIYRDIQKAKTFYAASGFLNRYPLQAGTRLAVKLDFLVGLLMSSLEAAGSSELRGVRAQMGELIGWRNLMWALTGELCRSAEHRASGLAVPGLETAATVRMFATRVMTAIKPIFNTVLGGAPIVQTGGVNDFLDSATAPLIETFYRASNGSALERQKLNKLLWDALWSEFGGRHELYEHNYAGNHDQIRLDLVNASINTGSLDSCLDLVQQCMGDYDLSGWTNPAWK